MTKKSKGAIVLIVFVITGVLVLLGSYFISFSLAETKISKSQQVSSSAYYLAEAGVNEAIWKLKNDNVTTDGDDAWSIDFTDLTKNPGAGGYWSASFSRSIAGGNYSVSIQNTQRGKGQIISTATVPLGGGKNAQRIIKTVVFKGLDSPIENSAIFTGGPSENMDINFSNIAVFKGNLFCNNNLNISWLSNLNISDDSDTEILEGKVLVSNNFLNSGSVNSTAVCAKNHCDEDCPGYVEGENQCPPASISMPVVDFESADPNSFKSRATTAEGLGQCHILCNGSPCSTKCVLTETEFSDLLWSVGSNGSLAVNSEITIVMGSIELKGGKNLQINGLLIANNNFYIGESLIWKKGSVTQSGFSQVTVTRPGIESPSGIMAERKMSFGLYSSFSPISIEGLVFASDEIKINSVPSSFSIIGGLMGRKISFSSLWQWLNITLNNDIILYGLGYKIGEAVIIPTYSPIITIDHWEESY